MVEALTVAGGWLAATDAAGVRRRAATGREADEAREEAGEERCAGAGAGVCFGLYRCRAGHGPGSLRAFDKRTAARSAGAGHRIHRRLPGEEPADVGRRPGGDPLHAPAAGPAQVRSHDDRRQVRERVAPAVSFSSTSSAAPAR